MFDIKFTIYHNADFEHEFLWVDTDGASVALTGTLLMHLKKKSEDTLPVLVLSSANGLATIDGSITNKFKLKFPRNTLVPTVSRKVTQTVPGGQEIDEPYIGDLINIVPGGDWKFLAKATVTVKRGATVEE